MRLLPKEYHLLKCLYENRNQTLSRQIILDKVWAMEDHTDRTIDDHVYRLRKKLSFLDDILIKTVRGVGYRLTIKQNHQDNPLYHDKEFRESMDVLYNKYIGLASVFTVSAVTFILLGSVSLFITINRKSYEKDYNLE
ncbi:helix-turn-helix domain-containing protein [Bacillus sp. FJAT-50051]|uniref:Helix-turn-helix domain-containing protein n=1 Tax=Neobacillus citreus TaxID=2833578 RepID=A0A9J6N1J7_9BACI|nr:helix-turn-helix domain-containing protein [Neobacillus citreus]